MELDAEEEIVLNLCKKGKVSVEAAETSLDDTREARAAVRAALDALRAQQRLAEAAESRLVDAAAILQQAGRNFGHLTPAQQAEAVRRLVPEITVTTLERPERRGRASKTYCLEASVVIGGREVIAQSAEVVGVTETGETISTQARPRSRPS